VSGLALDLGSAVCKSLNGMGLPSTLLCDDRATVLTVGFILLLMAGMGIVGYGLSRLGT
jgi:ABC-type amino acid transport substrate-binding protein